MRGLAMMLAPATMHAADVTGTWTSSMQSPDGSGGMQITFTFKQDGDKLTGSVRRRARRRHGHYQR